ncbi:FecCD family ABC transporter permease [Paracoccus denitrificans]|jgi:iron complex transport system permease protein|uniref:FecCD family ABC transporter permease n=1 Tax=Paracoccus denitrificans TaxID=266 RepID=UPI0008F05BF0|nr:iron ABC transporter permease [Paracoccus denitrificans]MCU7429907.1 iron ABC transporter permease [Paracoccus denitrificans]UPV97931.1 iron ABC transporter permease [Paracoccus denitrificans]GEK69467.1 ABC transporter permease [Paracoccus denitrificans]SFR15624.1 iron complex transport system permease protein [Paracoccus denitrificans]
MTPQGPIPHPPLLRQAPAGRHYALGIAVLAVLALASLAIGSRAVPPGQVLAAMFDFDPGNDLHLIVRELRLPRTLLAVFAGAALGLAGAVMQAVTRNPLAEPGLLGVNSGAAIAVVLGASALGLTQMAQYVWFGFLGAGLAGVAVFLLGRAHESGTDPVRLVLAGAGISVLLGAAASLVILNSALEVLDLFRNWGAGALEGRGRAVALTMGVTLVLGGALALALAPGLNAMALGHDTGRALGLRPERFWAAACLSVMILAGAATAAAGPIGFVGLVAPHIARAVTGPDNRRVLPLSALFAASTLLGADILGRIVAPPNEIAAGIVATILGGPFFIHVVRRFRLARL